MSKVWKKIDIPPSVDTPEVTIMKEAFGLEGGRSQGHTPDEFDPAEVKLGLEMEREHTDDEGVATGLVMDHLIEFPDYYSQLKQFEAGLEGSVEKADPATADDAEPGGSSNGPTILTDDLRLASAAFDWQRPGDVSDTRGTVRIAKRDKARQLVYGVVLVPEEEDIQGDTITAEEIEKTAHAYLAKSRVVGANHERQMDAHVVESYIAPTNMTFQGALDGEQVVPKGSWILVVKVTSPQDWAAVESGDYEGFSVGGEGLRDRVI